MRCRRHEREPQEPALVLWSSIYCCVLLPRYRYGSLSLLKHVNVPRHHCCLFRKFVAHSCSPCWRQCTTFLSSSLSQSGSHCRCIASDFAHLSNCLEKTQYTHHSPHFYTYTWKVKINILQPFFFDCCFSSKSCVGNFQADVIRSGTQFMASPCSFFFLTHH